MYSFNRIALTHYCLTGTFAPVLLKFRFKKKESGEKFPTSVAPMSR